MARLALLITIITLLLLSNALVAAKTDDDKSSAFFSGGRRIASGLSELLHHYGNVFVTPPPQRPPKQLQIALVGLPRTGTGSLIEALNVLGYTTVHADEYIENADLFAGLSDDLSMDAFATQMGERGFDALYYWSFDFVQWAATTAQHDSDDVKVILTVRDTPQKWAASFQSVGSSWDALWFSKPFIWWKPLAQLASSPLDPLLKELVRAGENEESLEQYYLNHMKRIQETVPADKLLMFNAKQGWEPLCQFLGQPVPRTTPEKTTAPFPHANERYLLQLENSILWAITWIWPLFPVLFLYAIWSLGRRLVLATTQLLFKSKKTPSQKTSKKQL